ncbi:hypothetical protein SAMN02799622_02837 [Methylobacterium sp. UNC378MF]|uniref:hypothetical protein n=1 Tax=Methylobacterium sp. UNC378MF TaxID=1502748 RepID=UPI00088B58EF|nr:hypothetical protein [Methylobacterium sp. UNC378MF]SDA22066.1 hypothetical protein SAMN02799622_02837 [Methylobacterium sp. UNC378MF]
MLHLAGLLEELERSEPARAAMSILEKSLARRSMEEQGAFWRAVDIYYVSRKAPPEAVAPAQAGPERAALELAAVS